MDLPAELEATVRELCRTERMRQAEDDGSVRLTFIADNHLYQLLVRTDETPEQFALTASVGNPFLEAGPGLMQAFVREMRTRYPQADYRPGGPHGADFSTTAVGRATTPAAVQAAHRPMPRRPGPGRLRLMTEATGRRALRGSKSKADLRVGGPGGALRLQSLGLLK